MHKGGQRLLSSSRLPSTLPQ
ncbi:hypothetical protein Nmel_001025 [Mimus melanotis]